MGFPWARRIGQIAILTTVIVAIMLIVLYPRARRSATTAEPMETGKVGGSPVPTATQVVQPQPQAVVAEQAIDTTDPDAFASFAMSGVAELHGGISLDQWKRSQDKLEDWQPSKRENFFDCRTLVKTVTLPSGREIKQFVYFYPPDVPVPPIFPTGSEDDLINHDCRLAMVRIETPTPTDREGHAFEQALRENFAHKYGESVTTKDTRYEDARWMADSEIISAYDPQPQPTADEPEDPGGPTVFVFARLPIVHEVSEDACCRIRDHYHSIEIEQFHHALALAPVDADMRERVANLFESVFRKILPEPDPPQLTQSRAEVLPTLNDWFKVIDGLDPTRHAAGLYVADRLLVAASDNGWPDLIDKDKAELRTQLQKLGANFQYDELGGCYEYSGGWLDQARELDPEGPVGQMSVLVSLARGGAPTLPKDKTKQLDIFHTVISDGEWLLSKRPDPATAAQIHFIMGDANATILALAGGAETEYGDPKEYQPEAPSARHSALDHYRAGLAIDAASDNAKYTWLQAWKISAGLLPATRWVYIYD